MLFNYFYKDHNFYDLLIASLSKIEKNFNGLNIFGTMKINSRQG